MMWALLAAWWVLVPALPELAWVQWFAHLAVVGALALSIGPRLWRAEGALSRVPLVATAVALLSLSVAMHAAPDRFPVMERWWAGMTGVAHGLFFLCVLAATPGPHDVERSRSFSRGLCFVLLAVLAAQVLTIVRVDLPQEAGRLAGGLGNPNMLGAFVAAAGLALAALGRWRPRWMLLLGGVVTVVLMTRSRGAAAALAAAVFVFLLRRNWRWVLGLGVVLGVGLVTIPNPLWERVMQLEAAHTFSRPFLWRAAWANILENPWGIGPGMNRYLFPLRAFDPEFPWLVHQRHAVGLTHNVFLTLALEWGWLAGLAGVSLALSVGRKLWRGGAADPLRQGATLGALVLFFELQIDGLEQNAVAFSLFLAFVAMALRRCVASAAGRGDRRGEGGPIAGRQGAGGRGRWVAAAVVILGLGLLFQDARRVARVAAIREAQAVFEAYVAGELQEAEMRVALEAAGEAAPGSENLAVASFEFEALALRRATSMKEEAASLESRAAQAWAAADRAREIQPADAELFRSVADFAYRRLAPVERTGERPGSVLPAVSSRQAAQERYTDSLGRLLRLDPFDVGALRQLAQEYGRSGQYEPMEATFERLFAIEPDDAAAWALRGRFRVLADRPEQALYAYVRAQESVFNCRLKVSVGAPRSQLYYAAVLKQAQLAVIRRRIAELRRALFL